MCIINTGQLCAYLVGQKRQVEVHDNSVLIGHNTRLWTCGVPNQYRPTMRQYLGTTYLPSLAPSSRQLLYSPYYSMHFVIPRTHSNPSSMIRSVRIATLVEQEVQPKNPNRSEHFCFFFAFGTAEKLSFPNGPILIRQGLG